MSEPWEWGYICPYCEERFSAHPLLIQHMMDEHNFKPTKNSHTARYWRHFYDPLSEAEKKIEAIRNYMKGHDPEDYFYKDIMKIVGIK